MTHRYRTLRVVGASLLLPALAFACYRLVWHDYQAFLGALDHTPKPFVDFAEAYWPMGQAILRTKGPSAHFLYTPFFAVLMAPLGALPLASALPLWIAIELVSSWLLLLIPALFFARKSEGLAYGYMAVAVCSQALLHNFRWGQVSVLVTLPVLVAAIAYARGRPVLSAVLLALSAAVKAYTGIFAIYFLLRRDFRALVMFAVILALCGFVIPALLLGTVETINFYMWVSQILALNQSKIAKDSNTQNFANVAVRLTGFEAQRLLFTGAGYVIAAGGVVAVVWTDRFRKDPIRAAALLLPLIPFVVTTAWPHYFVFLPFCQAVAWSFSDEASRSGKILQRAGIIVSVVLGSVPIIGLLPDNLAYGRFGVPLLASSAVMLVLWGQAWHREASASPEVSPATSAARP